MRLVLSILLLGAVDSVSKCYSVRDTEASGHVWSDNDRAKFTCSKSECPEDFMKRKRKQVCPHLFFGDDDPNEVSKGLIAKSPSDKFCCDADALMNIESQLTVLSSLFSKCLNCQVAWRHMLCAATCLPTQKDIIKPTPAEVALKSYTLRIDQKLCDHLWFACSDDDSFDGKRFMHHDTYRMGKAAEDRKIFCEDMLYPQPSGLTLETTADVDTRLALYVYANAGNHSETVSGFAKLRVEVEQNCGHNDANCLTMQKLKDAQGGFRFSGSGAVTDSMTEGSWGHVFDGARFCAPTVGETAAGVTTVCALLVALGFLANILHQAHFYYIPESALYIIVGVVLGLALQQEGYATSTLAFNQKLFVFVLLPPIIFNEGYSLKSRSMAYSLGPILVFAILGTLLSTAFIGVWVYAFNSLNWVGDNVYPDLTWPDALLFASLISAVDPVATMGIFKELKVDPKLEIMVCGEALVNDAVAIILFSFLRNFVATDSTDVGNASTAALLHFFKLVGGSVSVGLFVGFGSALFFKLVSFKGNPGMEIVIFLLFAYLSFVIAELSIFHFSGILSTLIAGVIMATYTQHNMSSGGVEQTSNLSSMVATLADMVVFLMTGVAMSVNLGSLSWSLTIITVVLCFVARGMSVFGLSRAMNWLRARSDQQPISWNHQVMLWWSGLRGAIAIGLSTEVPSAYRHEMQAATCFIVFLTVVLMGGTTPFMLKFMKVRMGVHVQDNDEKDTLSMKTWFLFNDYFVKPLFCNRSDAHQHLGHGATDKRLLHIDVLTADGLPKLGGVIVPQPYCSVQINGEWIGRSAAVGKTTNPKWRDGHFEIELPLNARPFVTHSTLRISVWSRIHHFGAPIRLGVVDVSGDKLLHLLDRVNPPVEDLENSEFERTEQLQEAKDEAEDDDGVGNGDRPDADTQGEEDESAVEGRHAVLERCFKLQRKLHNGVGKLPCIQLTAEQFETPVSGSLTFRVHVECPATRNQHMSRELAASWLALTQQVIRDTAELAHTVAEESVKGTKIAAKSSLKEGLRAAKEAANATRRISSNAAANLSSAARGNGRDSGSGAGKGKEVAKGKKAVENRKVIL